jgi:hypothetical protein
LREDDKDINIPYAINITLVIFIWLLLSVTAGLIIELIKPKDKRLILVLFLLFLTILMILVLVVPNDVRETLLTQKPSPSPTSDKASPKPTWHSPRPTITISSPTPTKEVSPTSMPIQEPTPEPSKPSQANSVRVVRWGVNSSGDTALILENDGIPENKFWIYTKNELKGRKDTKFYLNLYLTKPWLDGSSIYFGVNKIFESNPYTSWCYTSGGLVLKFGVIYSYNLDTRKLEILTESFERYLFWDLNKRILIGIGRNNGNYNVFTLEPDNKSINWIDNILNLNKSTLVDYDPNKSVLIFYNPNNSITIN